MLNPGEAGSKAPAEESSTAPDSGSAPAPGPPPSVLGSPWGSEGSAES